MSKFKVRGNQSGPNKQQPQQEKQEPFDVGYFADPYAVDPEEETEEPFNLEKMTGFHTPGFSLDTLADDSDDDDLQEDDFDSDF